jgi:hypothetical protein
MPYPLAHPAAVLPLRRFCPRYLSFPALIVGSLSPDAGYLFAHLRVDWFSHRFLAGSFGFCLPAGLLMLLVFYLVRSPLVGILPTRYRPAFLPLCQRPAGSPFPIIGSLLLGAWTHIFLDSITHGDGWLVEHLPILQSAVLSVGKYRFSVHEVLYAGCTFTGVAWLALAYLRWLETAARAPGPGRPGVKWPGALLLAAATLFMAAASRGVHRSIGIYPAGMISVLMVVGFLLGTGRLFSQTRAGH